MKAHQQRNSGSLATKKQILAEAREQLKKEFIGIDEVIDRLIRSVSSWYMLPDLQEKPTVVNLWGLTGVGKSTVVKRLIELLGRAERYYHYDLGKEAPLDSDLEDLCLEKRNDPAVMVLDEFQHARTIKEDGKEKDSLSSRLIWQLLDSGRFQMITNLRTYIRFRELQRDFKLAFSRGVKVDKGKIVANKEVFYSVLGWTGKRTKKEEVLSSNEWEDVLEVGEENDMSPEELEDRYRNCDEVGILEFLREMEKLAKAPKVVDCSNSLIFVIGNLDEAYWMASDQDPDMDADRFHQLTRKITLPQIKKALKERFRNEEIARLGNDHLLFPAFDRLAFEGLIDLELHRLIRQIREEYRIELTFAESLKKLIYEEGVYPTQGARPLLTTLDQMVKSELGNVLSRALLSEAPIETIGLKVEDDQVVAGFFSQKEKVDHYTYQVRQDLKELRKNRQDDRQALTAVHESGHVVASMVLRRMVPELVLSSAAGPDTGGFTTLPDSDHELTKKDRFDHVTVLLAGGVAEEMVFGKDRITCSGIDDINKATKTTVKMLKSWGMGGVPARYLYPEMLQPVLSEERNGWDTMAEQWLQEAREIARQTLEAHWELFLVIADKLSDRNKLDQEELNAILWEQDQDLAKKIEDDRESHFPFREQLKAKVQEKGLVRKNGHRPLPCLEKEFVLGEG